LATCTPAACKGCARLGNHCGINLVSSLRTCILLPWCRMLAGVASCPAQSRSPHTKGTSGSNTHAHGQGGAPQQQQALESGHPQQPGTFSSPVGKPHAGSPSTPHQQAPGTALAGHSSLPHRAQLLLNRRSGREANLSGGGAGGGAGMKALMTSGWEGNDMSPGVFLPLDKPQCISVTTSVHAVEQPGLPLENLGADAPGAAKLQCALEGGRTLHVTHMTLMSH
jgi:hypothetical protein